MKVVLYRHGKTSGNLRSAYIGVTDEPLCDEGRAELACVDRDLDRVFVSPMLRTRQTASILFPNARHEIVPGLAEMDFGVFEARNFEDLAEDDRYRAWVDGGCLDMCPGGEDLQGFEERCLAAFAPLVSAALENDETGIVFVVHGGTIMALMDRLALPHRGYYEWHVKPGEHIVANVDSELWQRGHLLAEL